MTEENNFEWRNEFYRYMVNENARLYEKVRLSKCFIVGTELMRMMYVLERRENKHGVNLISKIRLILIIGDETWRNDGLLKKVISPVHQGASLEP